MTETSPDRSRRNPFRPSFGTSPAVLAGRTDIIANFQTGLDEGPGAPDRVLLVSGPRGMGKTVLLNELEDTARQNGWLVVRANPGPKMIDEMVYTTLPGLLREHDPLPREHEIKGASVAGVGGVRRESHDKYQPQPTLDSLMRRLCEVLAEHGTGLLISIDELQAAGNDQLQEVTMTVQDSVRDDQDVALVAAGPPIGVKDLLANRGTTFLRRAQSIELAAATIAETRLAVATTVNDYGRHISDAALERMTDLSRGYPYLIQLVGYHAWRQASNKATIEVEDVEMIAELVIERIGVHVHQPALRDLSDMDRAYLNAMAADEGPSPTAEIARRLGKDVSYQSMYRKRLLDREIIVGISHGYVDFELPYMRDYLRKLDQ